MPNLNLTGFHWANIPGSTQGKKIYWYSDSIYAAPTDEEWRQLYGCSLKTYVRNKKEAIKSLDPTFGVERVWLMDQYAFSPEGGKVLIAKEGDKYLDNYYLDLGDPKSHWITDGYVSYRSASAGNRPVSVKHGIPIPAWLREEIKKKFGFTVQCRPSRPITQNR